MFPWTRARSFLGRHKHAEEHAAEAVGVGIAWRVFLAPLLGAGIATAAIFVPSMIDLSNNNGPGAVAAISSPGVKAVEAKATEGLAFRDYLYPRFRTAAARAHKPFGGYLFIHPNLSGKAQADYFLAYARPRSGDIEPVVDSEVGNPCSSAPTTLAALRELRARGYAPLLYSNTYWLGQLRYCAPALEAYRVWEAEYGPTLTRIPGFHIIGWQYTDNSGVKGLRIDGSRLYVPLSSLTIPKAKPKLTAAEKKAKASAARKAELRSTKGGFWAWREWRQGIGRWHGIAPAERDARPDVRHHIPRAWWAHLGSLIGAKR